MLASLSKIFSKVSTMLFMHCSFFRWLFEKLIKTSSFLNVSFIICSIWSFQSYFRFDLNIILMQFEWGVDERLNYSILKFIYFVLFDAASIIFYNFVLLLTIQYLLFELIFWVTVSLTTFFMLSVLDIFFNITFNCRWNITLSLRQFLTKWSVFSDS